MSLLNNQINEINKSFKNNFLKNFAINSTILLLTVLFFSIFSNLSWKIISSLFLGFVGLKWSVLFPLILDLIAIGGAIAILFSIKKNANNLIYKYDEGKTDAENINNIKTLLNHSSSSFDSYFISVVFLSSIDYFFNLILNQINHTFSPINEWYYQLGYFYYFPLLPVNILLTIVAFIIIAPFASQVYDYREKISNLVGLTSGKNTDDKKELSFVIFSCQIIFFLFCLVISLIKTSDWTLFTYLKDENTYVSEEKILKKLYPGCELRMSENRDKVFVSIVKSENVKNNFTGEYQTSIFEKENFYTTKELSKILQSSCKVIE